MRFFRKLTLCSLNSDDEDDDDDDDDEDEEGEEEEEINVVTVEKRKTARRRADGSGVPRRAHHSPLVLKRCHVPIHQHNNAAHPSTRSKGLAVKRIKFESSSSSSKALKHIKKYNMVERQRRNKLKLSLFALRDEIPEVANNEKAAEVVILKKATECIFGMQSDEQRLVSLKERLRKKSEHLKQRLEQLRTYQL
ncbi:hypothetical protein AAFF_G00390800 [Aldrovandia affinis]|uniref:BHLH domain-containing protein n=1 Tax=Aldrovandia affinis TaxID=143900 RepID=A0AAD7R456_9TELE|nr:hypothetical protein AAFF_G00390800 [Aldrovandia affinis]